MYHSRVDPVQTYSISRTMPAAVKNINETVSPIEFLKDQIFKEITKIKKYINMKNLDLLIMTLMEIT